MSIFVRVTVFQVSRLGKAGKRTLLFDLGIVFRLQLPKKNVECFFGTGVQSSIVVPLELSWGRHDYCYCISCRVENAEVSVNLDKVIVSELTNLS